jgi:hypothetical protein
MRFCGDHWSTLRAAIDERGLSHLIPKDGKAAAAAMRDEMENGRNPSNYDPLMAAHWGIVENAMELAVKRYGQHRLLLMADHPEQPELERPICALNFLHRQHDLNCKRPGCDWPKGARYEWMIVRAADYAKREANRLAQESA